MRASTVPGLLFVLVLLTTSMAGCLGGTDTGSRAADVDAVAGIPEGIALDGCREILGAWELSYDDVAAFLPHGFEPYGGGPLEPGTGTNVTMDLLAWSCTEPSDAAVLLPWLYAEPPDHLLDAETDAYRLALPCVGDAVLVERLQAWGVPCVVAEAEMTVEAETAAAAQWAFHAENANLSIQLEGQGVDGDERSIEPVFGQFHAVGEDLCAFTHLRLQDHIHWRGDGFTLAVEGNAPFPVPETPGSGLLALPDIWMNFTPVAKAEHGGSEASACPSGRMPPGSSTLPTAQTPGNRTVTDTLPDGTPIPAGFNLTGCSEQGGVFPADPTQAGDLPDGFTHVSSDPLGTTATIYWFGHSCELESDASYGEIWGLWEVRPPGHLAKDGAERHFLAFSVASSDERQVDVYEAWGMANQVIPARISVEVLQEAPRGRAGQVSGDAGGGTLNLYTSMTGEVAREPARTARVFGSADGELTGAMDLSWTGAENALSDGEATWTVDAPLTAVPPPPEPGLGFHRWGQSYDLTVDRVDLPGLRGR